MKDAMKRKLLAILKKHGGAGAYIGEYKGVPTMNISGAGYVLLINKKIANNRADRLWSEPGWMMTTLRGKRSVVIQCLFCRRFITPRPGVHTIDKIGRMRPCLECVNCGQGCTYFFEGWDRQKDKRTVLDTPQDFEILASNQRIVKGEVIA